MNPNKETVLGLPCYDNLARLDDPGSVDVAVVVVPPTVAVEVIENAGEAGSNVVVITAGFGETGVMGRT